METLLVDVQSAANALGIGPSKLYELISDGKLRGVKIGRRRLIPTDALREFADTLAKGEPCDNQTWHE